MRACSDIGAEGKILLPSVVILRKYDLNYLCNKFPVFTNHPLGLWSWFQKFLPQGVDRVAQEVAQIAWPSRSQLLSEWGWKEPSAHSQDICISVICMAPLPVASTLLCLPSHSHLQSQPALHHLISLLPRIVCSDAHVCYLGYLNIFTKFYWEKGRKWASMRRK